MFASRRRGPPGAGPGQRRRKGCVAVVHVCGVVRPFTVPVLPREVAEHA